jgi:signal transduction histidine kinase
MAKARSVVGPDAALAAAVAVLCLVPYVAVPRRAEAFELAVPAMFSLFMAAALVWRRRFPATSAGVVLALAAIHVAVGGYLAVPDDVIVLFALYAVAAHGRWPAALAGLAGLAAGVVELSVLALADKLVTVVSPYAADGVLSELGRPAPARAVVVAVAATGLAAWAGGCLRRWLAQRAAAHATADAARAADAERLAQLGAAGERTRIAREMHDIVAHSLSVVIAQADGGRYAAAQNPAAAAHALDVIAETGRAALADMRRILGVLRDPDQTGEPGLLAPVPDDQDIAKLVREARDAGVAASLVVTGQRRTLPPGAGLTLYRICQEALTNVLKHAGPAPTVTVLEQWTRQGVAIEVADDGRGAAAPSPDGPGHGILGMRERAELFGGTLEAGPARGGGWRVRATLPLPTDGGSEAAGPTEQGDPASAAPPTEPGRPASAAE